MNYMIASDIHGSPECLKKLLSYKDTFSVKKIILLGDLYYSGARNIPPVDFAPKDVVSILNSISKDLIVVKGNCESDVDLMVSNFPITENAYLNIFDREIFLTHGHKYSFDNLPNFNFDIFIQGHTHVSKIERIDNKLLLNPGSITLPKDNNHSFMILNEKKVTVYDLYTLEKLKEGDV